MSKMPVPKEWMTTDDLASHFSCSRSTIWRWVKIGVIPAPRRLGGLNRWRRSEIEALTAGTSAA